MPHLVLEATPALAAGMDWEHTLAAIHAGFAELGYAAEQTIKSRVHVTAFARSGRDGAGEQLVARLLTTRERPEAMQSAMAQFVHEILSAAVEHARPSAWVQCCVLRETAPAGSYLLRQWNPPVPAPGTPS